LFSCAIATDVSLSRYYKLPITGHRLPSDSLAKLLDDLLLDFGIEVYPNHSA